MISVSGEPNQYLRHYTQNMSYVPSYLVMGEIAGTPPRRWFAKAMCSTITWHQVLIRW